MRRLLTTTTALSIALAPVNPWPLMAQTLTETGSIVAEDGTVLCEPTAEAPCLLENYGPEGLLVPEVDLEVIPETAPSEAEAAAALEAEAAAAAEAEAAAAAEAEAAAAADAAAEAEAAAAAEAEAAAAAEAEAAAAAELEAAAAAEADAAVAAEKDAAAAAEAEAAAVAEAEAAAAAAKAEAASAAEAEAAAAAAAAEAAAVAEAATAAEAEAAAAAEAEAAAAAAEAEATATAEADAAAEAAAIAAAQEELILDPAGVMVDPSAGLAAEVVEIDPDAVPVEVPVVTEAEVETLGELLATPEVLDPTALGAAATLVPDAGQEAEAGTSSAEPPSDPLPLADLPTSPDAVTSVITVLGEEDTRSSSEEFAAAPVAVAPGKKDRLSDLEKVGLFALGALAIGAIIKGANDREDRQVVSNTGDRVVVLNPDGSYSVYKDDDTVLRRPGSTVRTETFSDGSTRTIVERADGTQVVTIRDATGRVLRRATYDATGREIVLIDDLEREVPVVISELPEPRPSRTQISAKDEDARLKARLAAIEASRSGRTFSLRQVREIPQVRALAATIDAGNVTFDSGSAAIRASEADELADLGGLMQDLLAENPAEMFLIEGHTDAVGRAAMNLALSDRRAESVALALSEYFEIPPENMVIQGYGEAELLIDTEANERRNRRVAVRVITPLLHASAN
jgi:outer membrane protein OmpA-like peptidoglycan-associated protein